MNSFQEKPSALGGQHFAGSLRAKVQENPRGQM
jgi:hypothetical protein